VTNIVSSQYSVWDKPNFNFVIIYKPNSPHPSLGLKVITWRQQRWWRSEWPSP